MPPTLDHVDLGLIRLLQEDGRTSFTALGKSLGLSPDAARDRLRRLEREQIVRVIGRMEPRMLGYELFAMLGVRLLDPSSDSLALAAALDRVDFAARTTGRYDALIEVLCSDESELVEILDHGIGAIGGIRVSDAFLYHDAVKWPGRLSSRGRPSRPSRPIGDADRRILQHLQADGRATYAALAESSRLGISTTRRRVKAMLEEGILRIATVVHPAVTERQYEASIMVAVTGPLAPVLEACAEIPEVTTVVGTSGRFDAILAAATADRARMAAVTERIRELGGVHQTETFPVLRVLKLPEAWVFPPAGQRPPQA